MSWSASVAGFSQAHMTLVSDTQLFDHSTGPFDQMHADPPLISKTATSFLDLFATLRDSQHASGSGYRSQERGKYTCGMGLGSWHPSTSRSPLLGFHRNMQTPFLAGFL